MERRKSTLSVSRGPVLTSHVRIQQGIMWPQDLTSRADNLVSLAATVEARIGGRKGGFSPAEEQMALQSFWVKITATPLKP